MSNRDQLRIQAVTASAHASASSSLVPESLFPPQTPPRTLTNSIRLSTIDTPMTGNSQGPDTGFRNIAEERDIVQAELVGHDCETDRDHLDKMFPKVASKRKIDLFLTKTDLYRNKRWTKIPKVAKREKDLYKPFCDIFEAILVHFKYSTRTAIDSHAASLSHIEGTEALTASSTPTKTSPDIIIKGSGRNFGPDPDPVQRKPKDKAAAEEDEDKTVPTPDYLSCVSPVEVKTERNRSYSEHFAQIGVYVRWVINCSYLFYILLTLEQTMFYSAKKSTFCLLVNRDGEESPVIPL